MWAQEFIYYNAFAQYVMALNDGQRRFLNSLNFSFIPFQIYLMGIILQVFLCEYYVVKMDMGLKGVGLSIGIANTFIFAGLNIYPLFIK